MSTRSAPLRAYVIALLGTLIAIFLRLSLTPLWGLKLPYIFFFFSVLATAEFAGLLPAILSLLLCIPATVYFFLPPVNSFAVSDTADLIGLLVFVLQGVAIIWLAQSQRKARGEAVIQERSLVATLESIGDAVIAVDVKGCVTYMNQVAESLTGWTLQEAKGKGIKEISPFVNETSRAPVVDPVAKVLREGKKTNLANHTVLLRRGGEGGEVPVEDSAAPIRDENGELCGVVLVFRDITERRAAEAARDHLADIVESSDDAIISKSLEGIILTWNRGAEQIFGYRAAEVIGKPVFMLMPPEVVPQMKDILARVRKGERIAHFQTRRIRKDGARITVSITVSPIRNPSGQVVGVSSIKRDVTQQKQAAEALRQMNEQLEQRVRERTAELSEANKELGSFSYSVSHDLRAPLRAINGYAAFLLEDAAPKLNAEEKRYLRLISESARNMGKLVDGLLHFSRLGRKDLERSWIDMNALASDVVRVEQQADPDREVKTVIEPMEGSTGDPMLVRQVLVNLISNAFKFTKHEPRPKIEIGGVFQSDPAGGGSGYIYYVRDNGTGFDMQYAGKLFGVFERLHTAEEFEGTGIGLAFARRIIQRHGGKIWAEAAPGEGATFYFTLSSGGEEQAPG